MAPTKQTARKSAGGVLPKQMSQISRRATGFSGHDSQNSQIDIFKANGKRTIVVEGQAEFCETPDLIHLSFLIEETASSLGAGVKKVISKLADVRAIVAACGVPNDDISSDSIGSSVEHTEYGTYVETKDKNSEDTEKFKRNALRVTYKMRSVVRICLEGENATNLFSKVCFAIMSAGIRSHEAPVYESTKITEQRNLARKEACENAKQKALCIVNALGDTSVTLGAPIALTDVHYDIEDDAEVSFLGNVDHSLYQRPKRVVGSLDDDDDYVTIPKKKARRENDDDDKMDDSSSSLLEETLAEQIFVVPPIKILACVKAIFEVDAAT